MHIPLIAPKNYRIVILLSPPFKKQKRVFKTYEETDMDRVRALAKELSLKCGNTTVAAENPHGDDAYHLNHYENGEEVIK